MSRDLAREGEAIMSREMSRDLARKILHPTPEIPDLLPMLDIYSPGGISTEPAGINLLATISAGYRAPSKDGHAGLPQVSRDGTIHLHDPTHRAPGLAAALAARNNRSLTIAFPYDNPAAFVQQWFASYSATHLRIYGDEYALTEITPRGHVSREAGQQGYQELLRQCKPTISIYFALAEWTPTGPHVLFPDGVGLYRIRSNSRNTMRNLRAALRTVATFTRGQIVGVPFDLALDYRDVAGPDGTRHNVPCWTFVMRPPEPLSSRTFTLRLSQALAEGHLLQLPPPTAETIEQAERDYTDLGPLEEDDNAPSAEPSAEPTEQELRLVTGGGQCDVAYYERAWFAAVKGTHLDIPNTRRAWLTAWSSKTCPERFPEGYTDSLATFLASATEDEATALIAAISQDVVTGNLPAGSGVLNTYLGLIKQADFAGLDTTAYELSGDETDSDVHRVIDHLSRVMAEHISQEPLL